jgi:CheY-like chemotaxis protein
MQSPEKATYSDVMIVEDDADLRDTLAEVLRYRGYRVAVASNGAEAKDYLAENQPPGVILLDLMMPVMDGWEFRNSLLADPVLSRIPIILLSGAGDLLQHARGLSAVACLAKPVKLKDVVTVVNAFAPSSSSTARAGHEIAVERRQGDRR